MRRVVILLVVFVFIYCQTNQRNTGVWKQLSLSKLPTSRTDSCYTQTFQYSYIVGGAYGPNDDTLLNDVWQFEKQSQTWTLVKTSGVSLPPVRGHSCAIVNDNKLVLFGGLIYDNATVSNSMYLLDLTTFAWTKVATSATIKPRFHFQAAALDDKFFIFGGQDTKANFFNDFWQYSFSTNSWQQIRGTGAIPTPRSGAAGVAFQNKFFLYGGYSTAKGYLNDTYVFDMTSNAWSILPTSGELPGPLANAAVTLMGENMWIFGGQYESGTSTVYSNKMFVLSIVDDFEWSQALPVTKDVPTTRIHSTLAAGLTGNTVYMFGGENQSGIDGNTWSFYVLQ